MEHWNEEEGRQIEQIANKYWVALLTAGESFAKIKDAEVKIGHEVKLSNYLMYASAAGVLIGIVGDVRWLVYLSLVVFAGAIIMLNLNRSRLQQDIERLNDKIDLICLDWRGFFGNDDVVRDILPRVHIEASSNGGYFKTSTKMFAELWQHIRFKIYCKVLSWERAQVIYEIEKAELEKEWESEPK